MLSEASANSRLEKFEFTGAGSEYFGIWIVNILLSIVTLGIYSAWAKVRNKQYFYGNTYMDGSAFEYTAEPTQILKGRIFAVIAFIAYQTFATIYPTVGLGLALLLMVIFPWIAVKSLAFNARYSQYRNIPFRFNQNFKQAYMVLLLLPLLMILPFILIGVFVAMAYFSGGMETLNPQNYAIGAVCAVLVSFLIFPFIAFKQKAFMVDNHLFGTSPFTLRIEDAKPFYSIYLKAAAIPFIVFFAVIALLKVAPNLYTDMPFLAPIFQIVLMAVYLFLFSYVTSRIYRLIYQKSAVGGHKLRSNMPARGHFWLTVTNTIGIILTLGLFIPWAKVRSAKFRAKHTALRINGDLDNFLRGEEEKRGALGEELGEIFDVDIAI